jgi:hypothetical protein
VHKEKGQRLGKKKKRIKKVKEKNPCTSFALPVSRKGVFLSTFSHYNNGLTASERSRGTGKWCMTQRNPGLCRTSSAPKKSPSLPPSPCH